MMYIEIYPKPLLTHAEKEEEKKKKKKKNPTSIFDRDLQPPAS
jgi:hypothetical protein